VKIERLEWLCYGRVPFGHMTLFEGDGGRGKMTFLTGIIALASVGIDFFTGLSLERGPQNILIVGIEDATAVFAQRLKLYKADMARIHFVDATCIGGQNGVLMLPDHVEPLEQAIIQESIGVVYITPCIHISRAASSRPLFGRLGLPPMMFDPQLGEPIELV